MRMHILIFIYLFFIANWVNAEETDPNLNKTLSEAEILTNIKKTIKPVEINDDEAQSSKSGLNGVSSKLDINAKADAPDNINILLSQAYKASQMGQIEASIVLYHKALKIDKDNTYILFAMGSLYQKLKQYDEAKGMYERLLTIDPTDEQGISNYLALIAERSPSKALKQLQELEKVNQSYSPVKAQIGMIYANIGEYNLAEMYFKKAITISPEVVNYRYNLAILYDRMARYPDAEQMYRQVINFAGDELSKQDADIIKKRISFLQTQIAQ